MSKADSGAEARKPGRRPKVKGPPPFEASTMGGGVLFTPEDVCQLAAAAGLKLAGGASDTASARGLSGALNDYVLFARMGEQRRQRLGAEEWGQAVARWAREGRVLFGAETESVSAQRSATVSAGYALLSGLNSFDDAIKDKVIGLAYEAGLFANDQELASAHRTFWLGAVVERLQPMLAMLEFLGGRAWDNRIAGRPTEYEKRGLFRGLKCLYESIHAPARFTVSNRAIQGANSSQRARVPQGAALAWCRAVFALAPDRIIGRDTLPEIKELAGWAEKPDAVAEHIRELGRLAGGGGNQSGKGVRKRGSKSSTSHTES